MNEERGYKGKGKEGKGLGREWRRMVEEVMGIELWRGKVGSMWKEKEEKDSMKKEKKGKRIGRNEWENGGWNKGKESRERESKEDILIEKKIYENKWILR